MSCSRAATISTSARATCRISVAASVQVSTTCRSTVNRWIAEACGSSRIRSHSGRICASAPVSSRVSQVPSSPRPEASSRTSSRRASGGQGSGSGGHSRASRAAVGGASTTSRSAASAAARSSSAGSSAGRARRSSTTSLAARATPSASGVSDGRRTPTCAGRASASSTRRQVSRDRWVIRRPSSRTCTCAARASALPSCGASAAPSSVHSSGAIRSVARPARSCTRSRTSSRAIRLRSSSTCGTSTSQVATSDLSTVASRIPPSASLRSGTDSWASSPIRSCRERTSLCSSGSRSRASRRHCASIVVRSRRVRLGSPVRCRTSSSPEATLRSASRGGDHLGKRAHRVVDVRAGVPQRVPELFGDPAQLLVVDVDPRGSLTSTTSRSECGASSPRP